MANRSISLESAYAMALINKGIFKTRVPRWCLYAAAMQIEAEHSKEDAMTARERRALVERCRAGNREAAALLGLPALFDEDFDETAVVTPDGERDAGNARHIIRLARAQRLLNLLKRRKFYHRIKKAIRGMVRGKA